MEPSAERDIGEIFAEGTAIDEAMRKAWERAVRRHRRLGIPLLVWEDGRVVELDPHEVQVSQETDDPVDPFTYGRPASGD